MPDLISLFPDVADAMGIESVTIVEKDYYVVELLRLLRDITPETHILVFAGGTALSKAGIALDRMSEDVDIKLVPVADFRQNYGRDRRKKIRRDIVRTITDAVTGSGIFSLDENHRITRNEYRYNEIYSESGTTTFKTRRLNFSRSLTGVKRVPVGYACLQFEPIN
ncbi:TPA: nucleotidyl transferase AbiEii/AbiGii toxin family protein [Klebsiella oxytoca]|uniref:Nucleotidyl transferase AbiEii/AbiGii toxin family protein n=1 Tax=Klebsiella oxytoca TaxID=571 RepID=A0AAN5RGL8_KLEOX|nr:nucleotidyl transferase AbiEii/AbiGii toxin family protein [Klebsiella oxytoca]